MNEIDLVLGRTAPFAVTPALMVTVLVVAAALSIPSITWRYFGLFTTLVHELGHAFAALLTGRRVTGLHLRRDHSGSLMSRGVPGVSAVVSGFFGYPAPALVGLGLLAAVFTGYTRAALVASAVIIVLTLFFVRNLFGALVVIVCAAAGISLLLWVGPSAQSVVLLVVGVALLVGAVRGLATVIGVHLAHRSRLQTSDAYLLYRRTGIPSPVWLLGFTAVIGGCCWLAVTGYLSTLK